MKPTPKNSIDYATEPTRLSELAQHDEFHVANRYIKYMAQWWGQSDKSSVEIFFKVHNCIAAAICKLAIIRFKIASS